MTEYNLNVLSFHYNFENDPEPKNMTIEKRIEIIKTTLDENKDKKIDVLMCSEDYLCHNINNKSSSITKEEKDSIYEILKILSAKFSEILFLPGTYNIYDDKNECYDIILPIFFNGELIKEYKKFSVPQNDTLELCAANNKKFEANVSNNILEVNGRTFVLGICSDIGCSYDDVLNEEIIKKNPIGLFVSYGIGIPMLQNKLPIIIIDGINTTNIVSCPKKINCNSNIINLLKNNQMNINYISFKGNIIVSFPQLQIRLTERIFNEIRSQLMTIYDNLDSNPINSISIDSNIKKIKETLELVKKYKNYIKTLQEIDITTDKNLKISNDYIISAEEILELYNKLPKKSLEQKYLKYKTKYLQLKKLIKN